MDKAYGLTKTGNSEVRFCWHTLCLRSKALFIVPHVLDFVTSMVRYCVPFYSSTLYVLADFSFYPTPF